MPAAALWSPPDDDVAHRVETHHTAAAISSPPSSSSSSTRRYNLPSLLLVPPLRYELVEERLHRGAYPTLRNFPFLARLRLKTIISVIPEPPSADLADFAHREGITLHHFPTLQHVDSVTLSASTVSSALSLMIAIEHLPLYLHCLDGVHSSGLIIAMLRHLQYRASAAVLDEYARFGAEVTEEVVDRLQRWQDSELTVRIPTNLPHWLWDGKHVTEHPTMRIDDASMGRRGDGAPGGRAGTATGATDKKKTKAVTAAQRAEEEMQEKTREEQHNASLESRWGRKRSWLHYDALFALQSDRRLYIAHPADSEERYTEDVRHPGLSVYLEALALEGFTMTNTFPRPLHLFHVGVSSGAEQQQAG